MSKENDNYDSECPFCNPTGFDLPKPTPKTVEVKSDDNKR